MNNTIEERNAKVNNLEEAQHSLQAKCIKVSYGTWSLLQQLKLKSKDKNFDSTIFKLITTKEILEDFRLNGNK
jgi:hypothetical protein